ncbi:response regulator transcription factor [Natronospora cellulosivora (SeqCode)]
MSYSIYLLEDDKNLNQLLSSYLEKEGWQVTSFFTGEKAMKKIQDQPDLWILDIMLPDIDGYQVISHIKEHNQSTPVIFISARDADLDRIVGLEKGSDDYLAKPFLPRELVIRCSKILERVYGDKNEFKESVEKYSIYKIDREHRGVIDDQENLLDLTSKEFDMFIFFLDNLQKLLSRDQILNVLWGDDYFGTDRVVDDLVRRLRKKMPLLKIETVYGYGYRLVKS